MSNSTKPQHTFQGLFFLVSLILIGLASFIRLANLHAFPPVLNRDEAALAYNAKLVQESGKDEWGKSTPLQFRSFGDYKLPGYIYTLIPFFQILDQQDWVVRLPSALAGVGVVIGGAIFISQLLQPTKLLLFSQKQLKGTAGSQAKQISIFLLGLFFLTFTPVFFFYSRMAWEANLALFWLVLALNCVVLPRQGRARIAFDLLATIFLILAVFTYNTPLLLLPFLLPLPMLLRGVYQWKTWLPVTLLGLVILGIGGIGLTSVADQKSGITIFSDETLMIQYPAFRQQFPGPLKTVLGNKYVYWGTLISNRYIQTFSPDFLVSRGGSHPWHSILGRGHLYWSVYFLFVIGVATAIFAVIKIFKNSKFRLNTFSQAHELLLMYLLLVSPLPAVITVDAPHATRSLFTFLMITVVAVYGLLQLVQLLEAKKKWLGVLIATVILVIFSIESTQYLNQFFYRWRNELPAELHAGFPRLVHEIAREHPNEMIAVVDGSGYLYILGAWYLQISPTEFFATIQRHQPDNIGLSYGYHVGNLHFINDIQDRLPTERYVLQQIDEQWEMIEY